MSQRGGACSWLALLLLGCSSGPPCAVTFRGNFAADFEGTERCVTLEGGKLSASTGQLQVELELGDSVQPGSFSSASAAGPWRALWSREPGCVYSAGTEAVPAGSYSLTLTGVSPAHGTLVVLQGLHSILGADCGAGDAETVSIDF